MGELEALRSLEGLSVGDAYGERFFGRQELLQTGLPPALALLNPTPWRWTDDTAMAVALVRILLAHGEVVQDKLATEFARVYLHEPARGYGAGMHGLLPELARPGAWRACSPALFDGQGSRGNGAAMRVAPLGAFFCDDLDRVAAQAALSAEVTHAHPEGIAGAIAVAVAAALAVRGCSALIVSCLPYVPAGPTRRGLMRARDLGPSAAVAAAAKELGNGSNVTAEDTVPFVLWSAARRPGSFADAVYETVRGLGDIDTTAAMVGGIVAASGAPIPPDWLSSREALPSLD
jgi:ADP-ribosylglycohydrolase